MPAAKVTFTAGGREAIDAVQETEGGLYFALDTKEILVDMGNERTLIASVDPSPISAAEIDVAFASDWT